MADGMGIDWIQRYCQLLYFRYPLIIITTYVRTNITPHISWLLYNKKLSRYHEKNIIFIFTRFINGFI